MITLNPADTTIGHLVSLRHDFMASIDLERAYDPNYRNSCSHAYIYVPEDELFFKNIVNALGDRLPNRRHTILEIGAFGVGKSLLDIVRGDLFTMSGNSVVLDKLPQTDWKAQIEALTSQTGYLVIYIPGAHPEVRSNLERALVRSLQKALPPGMHLTSEYEHALSWIENLQQSESQSNLRLSFGQKLSLLSAVEQPWTIGQIEEGLRQREPNALNAFHHASAAAIGWPLDPLGPTTAEGVYDEALRNHIGSSCSFSGILIFFDEFAQWARTASPGDISTLQTFVEWVNRSRRVAMVMSSQVRPQHQGSGYHQLETLISRTHEEAFKRTSYTALLCGALDRLVQYSPVDSSPYWIHLNALHHKLFPNGNTPEKHVRRYYPFHPTTVKALTVLTDQLGYHERSITQYLSSGDNEAGFGQFLQEQLFEDDRATLKLITLDRIFQYFAPRLREDRQPIYQRYEQALANLTDELSVRLIQTLALCDVLEVAVPVTPTEEGLILLLNLPPGPESLTKISHHLQELVEAELITIDVQGRYKLVAGGSLTLPAVKRAVNQRKQDLLSSTRTTGSAEAIQMIESSIKIATDLRRHSFSPPPDEKLPFGRDMKGKNRQIESAEYAKRFKISHTFEVELVTRTQLLTRLSQVTKDPTSAKYETILVVIATDDDTPQQELDKIRQVAHALAETGIVVGVPKRPFALSDTILNLLAVNQVIEQEAYRGSPVSEQAKRQYQNQLLQAIASEVCVEAFEWYTPHLGPQGQPLFTKSLSNVIDHAALHLGSDCPDQITQAGLVGNSKVRTDWTLVDDLLRANSIRIARRSSKHQKDRILRGALAPIGMINISEGGAMAAFDIANVVEPDQRTSPHMKTIWDILDLAIGKGGDGLAIVSVMNQLSRRPYWLPRELIVYILAAFIGLRDLHIYSSRSNTMIVRDADNLKKVWNEPANYDLRLVHRVPVAVDVQTLLQDTWDAIRDAIPTKTHWVDIRGATYLTQEHVEALASDIRAWDAEIGRKVREIATHLSLSLPSPAKQWLEFLADLGDAKFDRNTGETYTVALAERLAPDSASLSNVTGLLDHQMRQLNDLVKDVDTINRAYYARQSIIEKSSLTEAWTAFCAQPLSDVTRRDLKKTLLMHNVTTQSGSIREQPISQESFIPNPSPEPIRSSTPEKESDQSIDWKVTAARIVDQPIGTKALQRCISTLQVLVEQYEVAGKSALGEAVLAQIVNALMEQGENM